MYLLGMFSEIVTNSYTLNLSINQLLPLSTGENRGADTESKYVQYPDNLNIKGRTIIVFVIWF